MVFKGVYMFKRLLVLIAVLPLIAISTSSFAVPRLVQPDDVGTRLVGTAIEIKGQVTENGSHTYLGFGMYVVVGCEPIIEKTSPHTAVYVTGILAEYNYPSPGGKSWPPSFALRNCEFSSLDKN
jgi:hypothetical protein